MISNTWFIVAALSLMTNAVLLRVLVSADRERRRLRVSNDCLVEDLADLHLQHLQQEIRHKVSTALPKSAAAQGRY